MFDLILARGWQAIHSLLHSPTRFQRTPATKMSFYDVYFSLVVNSKECSRRSDPACRAIARAIDARAIDLIRRHAVLKGSAAAASLGEDEVAALGGELIEESHRFPYVYVGLFGAVVAFIAFYIGRRTRNDAYYSV